MTVQPSRQRQRVELKSGDTIYKIASSYCGSRDEWRELLLYNDLDVFDELPIGKSITIPTQDEIQQITTALVDRVISQASSVITDKLDLSKVKQPDTGDYSLISWIL